MIDGSCGTLSSVLLAFDSNGIPPYDSPIESLMSYIVADDSAFLIASTDEEDSRIPSLQLDKMIVAESTLMVVDAVFSLRSLSVRSAPLTSSLVEDIAGETWNLQGALETCGSLRKMLRAWFAHSCERDVTGDSPTNELMTLVQSSQRSLPSELRQRLVNGGGGISEEDGVIYFNLGSPIGEPLRQFYIPKSTPLWRKLLVRDAHRLCGHGGREATLAHCNQFYLPAGQREVRNLLFRCVPCRLEKARRCKSAPILQKDESKLMLEEPPYWRVDADVLHLGEKKKILVVVCRSTGHCSLFSLNKEDMTDILKCLHRAQLQRGGLRHVYVDNASYFCSALFHQEMQRTLGAEVHTLASSSPWEACRANRLHGVALSILRKNLRFVRGRIPDGDDDFGLLLDYLAYVLNSRPLGQLIEVDSKMRPTTPDLLAFGYEKQVGPLQVAGFPLKCFPARDALAFRKHYLETYWRSLRTHVLETLGGSKQRRWRPYVGEPVAVIRQRMRKADIASCLGFVDSILSGNRVLVLLPGGRKQVESIHNLCPFEESVKACDDFIGPSREGARVAVKISDAHGDCDFYTGTIRRDGTTLPSGPTLTCLVTWDDGSEPEWLNLDEEVWKYCDETSPPKLSRLPRRKKFPAVSAVSVTNLDGLNQTDYIDLFKAGTTEIVFAENWLHFDGSILVPENWFNASFAADISNIATKYNATTLVGVSILPFLKNESRSIDDFKVNVQSFLKNYSLDGVVFEVWTHPFPVGKQWDVVNKLAKATKSLKTDKGGAAAASLTFLAANFTTSSALWDDFKTYQPWRYMDDNHAVFDSLDVDLGQQITLNWANDVVSRLTSYSMKPSKLSLCIIPEALGYNIPPEMYRHLVDLGAPTYGDGHFKGYYYNTQKQIKEKLTLESKYGLRGLSFIFPSFDLPPYNTSSLLFAAA